MDGSKSCSIVWGFMNDLAFVTRPVLNMVVMTV
jgi:hypothetical protein